MANEQNLIPFTSDQSREAAKRNGRKGGIAAGKARRERKRLQEEVEKILQLTPQISSRELNTYAKMGMSKAKKKYTIFEMGMLAMAVKFMKGDKDYAKFLLEIAGLLEQDNTQNINLNTQTPIMINYDYGDDEEDTTEQVEEAQEETAEPDNQGGDNNAD